MPFSKERRKKYNYDYYLEHRDELLPKHRKSARRWREKHKKKETNHARQRQVWKRINGPRWRVLLPEMRPLADAYHWTALLSEEVSQVRDGYGQKVKIWEAKNVWEAKIKMS